MGVTRAQLSKIWAAGSEVGLEEEQLRDLVADVSGQRSISSLTFRQAGEVIEQLVRLGARAGDPTKKPSGRRHGRREVLMITTAQRDHIEQLRGELGGMWTDEPYYGGACKRLLRKPRPTTAGDGAKVIQMLKRRLEHDRRKVADGEA